MRDRIKQEDKRVYAISGRMLRAVRFHVNTLIEYVRGNADKESAELSARAMDIYLRSAVELVIERPPEPPGETQDNPPQHP